MKGRRHTAEQIVRKLHDADRLIAESESMAVVLKQLGSPSRLTTAGASVGVRNCDHALARP